VVDRATAPIYLLFLSAECVLQPRKVFALGSKHLDAWVFIKKLLCNVSHELCRVIESVLVKLALPAITLLPSFTPGSSLHTRQFWCLQPSLKYACISFIYMELGCCHAVKSGLVVLAPTWQF